LTDYEDYHREGRTADFGDVFERVRAHSVRWVLRNLPTLRTDGRFADVGAGEGRYLPIWRTFLPHATLIAVDVSRIASERSAARNPDVEHVVAPAEDLPIDPASVQGLASIEVLEHVEDPNGMLTECHRVLEPGGWALISTPCGNAGSLEWWMNFLRRRIRPGMGGGVLFGATDDPTHLRRYRGFELRSLLKSHGFEVDQIFFHSHFFTTLAQRWELFINGHINLRRRSVRLAEFVRALLDWIALIDWRLLKRSPIGSSMIVVVRRH
jgi:SAM-dependent methyltransferase